MISERHLYDKEWIARYAMIEYENPANVIEGTRQSLDFLKKF